MPDDPDPRLCDAVNPSNGGVCIREVNHPGSHRAAGSERWSATPAEATTAAAARREAEEAAAAEARERARREDLWSATRPAWAVEADERAAAAAEALAAEEAARIPEGKMLDKTNQHGRSVIDQGRKAYDWVAIRRRYVEGVPDRGRGMTHWPSLDEVAAHFGVSSARVREKSSAEGWVAARSRWQAQMERTRQQAKASAMAREASALDSSALSAAKLGLQLCTAKLAELGQAAQARRASSVGEGPPLSGIDAQEQQRLAYAVDLWHKIGLRAVGDPETHRVEITGANGKPIEIASELRRDDPDRISGVLAVLAQAGLGDIFGRPGDDAGGPAELDVGGDGVEEEDGAR